MELPLAQVQTALQEQNRTSISRLTPQSQEEPEGEQETVSLKHVEDSTRFELYYRSSPNAQPVRAAYVEGAFTGGQCPTASSNPSPSASKGTIDLYHTWTNPTFRGKKFAEIVVAFAMEYAAKNQYVVSMKYLV